MSNVQSFTFGSDEGMGALVAKHREYGFKYEERWTYGFNAKDFETLIYALKFTAENDPSMQSEPAADFLSSIAESLGVEFI